MNFELIKMTQSKSRIRQQLARRPLAEKLEMLDALRERSLALGPKNRSTPQANPARIIRPNSPVASRDRVS